MSIWSLCPWHFEGQAGCKPSLDAINQNADLAIAFPQQDTCRSGGAEPFVTVDQAGLSGVDCAHVRFDIEQGQRDCARKVTLQPLGAAADIDELQRRIGSFGAANTSTALDRDRGKVEAMLAPLMFVWPAIADYVRNAHPQ